MKTLYDWLIEQAIDSYNGGARISFYMMGIVLFSIGWLSFVLGGGGGIETSGGIDVLLVLLIPMVYLVLWLSWPLLDIFVTWCYSYVTGGVYAPSHVVSLFFIDAGIVENMERSHIPVYAVGVGSVLCLLTGVIFSFIFLLSAFSLWFLFWVGLFCFVVYTVLWVARALYRVKNMVGRYP